MKFNYGGQALIEGVMIRGRKGVSVAVRDPDGRIVTHTERLEGGLYRTPVGQLPFIRHSTMRGTRWASARITVSAYSAIVAACTPLVVVIAIALPVYSG